MSSLGGMFNKKSTSSTNSNTNHTAANQSEIYGTAASVQGSNNNITMLDGGAIDDAFSFGALLVGDSNALNSYVIDRAFDTTDLTTKQAFGFGDNLAMRAFDFGDDVMQKAFRANADNTAASFGAALQAVQPQPIDLRLVGMVGAAVVAVFYLVRK